MARQFDSRDAKRLITKHRELLEELRRAEKTFNGLRAAVKETTDAACCAGGHARFEGYSR